MSSAEGWKLGTGGGSPAGEVSATGLTLVWDPRRPPVELPPSKRADGEPRGMRARMGREFDKCFEALNGSGGMPGGADIVCHPDHHSTAGSAVGLPTSSK